MRFMLALLGVFLAASIPVLGAEVKPAKDADPKLDPETVKFFEQHVRPLLAEKCFKCHSEKKQSGEFRIDSRAAILAGGESGDSAIVPGKPDESVLVEAIRYEAYEMPPDGKMKDKEIAILVKWVEMGAPWPGSKNQRVEHHTKKPKITDEDRAYWAFQKVVRPNVPKLQDDQWSRNEIDAFILRKLRENTLQPSPEAEPATLQRRLYSHLIGLPPKIEDVQNVADDPEKFDYTATVELLLKDKRYGEKWARHWLDLVRYAESDGFRQDAYRPQAWRYRDYVIDAFNTDKPYDRFITEQLAGDEVAPHDPDALVATGFLRHWIYEYNQRDVRTQWQDILNDMTDVTGDVFLSMGMGCARCHDHKFDPILQKDYFRLQAFFTPFLPRDDVPIVTSEERSDYEQKRKQWEEKTAEIRQQMDELLAKKRASAARGARIKFPKDIQAMMVKPVEEREPLEHQLAEVANYQVIIEVDKVSGSSLKGDEKKEWDRLAAELKTFDSLKPKPLPVGMTVTDVGANAPETYITGKRNPEPIEPGYLSVIDESPAEVTAVPTAPDSTGRRTALAQWIASPDNPLTARVMVNRIWQYHFGRGLVNTASDFGNLGEKPSHPELLDWLAAEFVENGWSVKHIHRLILNSATYRQSSVIQPSGAAMKVDPHNRLLWRMNVRRLQADQIRDFILAASGELSSQTGGPSVNATTPRRSIYTKLIRNRQDPLFGVFDAPRGLESIAQRNSTTTSTQALLMFNGEWALGRAKVMAARMKKLSDDNQEKFVSMAMTATFSRVPDKNEVQQALAFLKTLDEEKKQSESIMQKAGIVDKDLGNALHLAESMGHKGVSAGNDKSLPKADFTIEAYVKLESLYPDATVRTIVSRWDNNKSNAGWAFGVTSTKSAYKPRNLILQFIGKNEAGKMTYEVIPSNLHLELNKSYYVAASVKLDDQSESGVTFYVKELKQDAELQIANVKHSVTSDLVHPSTHMILGGRHGSGRHVWDGLLDDVRLTASALQKNDLLIFENLDHPSTVGYWRFNDVKEMFADHSRHGRNLIAAGQADAAEITALVDFCHVLLNSNEFIYID